MIITLEQGKQINQKFLVLEDSIKKLKLGKDSIKTSFETEYRNALRYKNQADTFQYWYTENKKIYLTKEERYKADRRHYMGFSFVLMVMVVLFAHL